MWEERHKIERLSDIINTSLYCGISVSSDLEYYAREESLAKKSSRMQQDDRNQMINTLSNEIQELLFSEIYPGSIIILDSFRFQTLSVIQRDVSFLL